MPTIKTVLLSPIRLYYYLVRILICVPLSWPKYKDGTRIVTANMITVARVIFLIPPAIYMSVIGQYLATVLLLTLSYIGDTADGEYARMFKETTDLGALLDRAFDKICNLSVIASILILHTVTIVNNSPELQKILEIMALLESVALLYSIHWEFLNAQRFEIGDKKAKSVGKSKMGIQSTALTLLFATMIGVNLPDTIFFVVFFGTSVLSVISLFGHFQEIGA